MSDRATISATKGGLLFALVFAVVGTLVFSLWSWGEKRSGQYTDGSICGRRIDQSTDRWLAVFNTKYDPKDLQTYSQKIGEASAKAYTADRDDFVATIDKIRFAERTKIMKEGWVCLPAGPEWPLREFEKYDEKLEARLKADPNVCKLEFETDVMAYLASTFPCQTSK